MYFQLFISWLFVANANDCYNGNFETNNLGDCVFNCNHDDVKYISKEEVTWNQLMHSCYNVREASQLGDCSSTTDLVWGDGCSCPYCSCAVQETSGTAVLFEQMIEKTCYNCTCDTHPYDTTVEGFVFGCDNVDEVDDGYAWTDFTCPVTMCTDDDDNERSVNRGWFEDVANQNVSCDKYCYCGAGAEKECVTGFENILASDNTGLVAAFDRECRSKRVDVKWFYFK